MTHMIPLAVPVIEGNEWKYTKECLDTGWVSSVGKFVDTFEESLASYVGAQYAVACVNGTAALHISLLVAGVKPEEEVLVPALTFVAPVNTIRYVGAWPVFMDVDRKTFQLDVQKVIEFITQECREKNGRLVNKKTQRFVSAILPVHILGHVVDMDPLMEIAKRFNLVIIEDATEGLGAMYKNRFVGSIGSIGCFSFNGNKIITTGGGGMIVTNNKEWAQKAKYLTTQAKDDPIEYIHNEIGYNYRLTNVQAAMGVAQMERLSEFVDAKRAIAQRYQEGLSGVAGITLPQEAPNTQATFWLYTMLVDKDTFGLSSRELMAVLGEAGIQSRPLWHPIHSLEPFKDSMAYNIQVANDLYDRALSIPCSANLTIEDQNKVIEVIKNNYRLR